MEVPQAVRAQGSAVAGDGYGREEARWRAMGRGARQRGGGRRVRARGSAVAGDGYGAWQRGGGRLQYWIHVDCVRGSNFLHKYRLSQRTRAHEALWKFLRLCGRKAARSRDRCGREVRARGSAVAGEGCGSEAARSRATGAGARQGGRGRRVRVRGRAVAGDGYGREAAQRRATGAVWLID